MLFYSFFRRAAVGMLALPLMFGCRDELPTATGEDLFPGGARPSTVDLTLEPEQFVLSSVQQTDFARAADAGYLVVARDFEQELNANALVRFTGFPETVTYTINGALTTEQNFTYQGGQVVTSVVARSSAAVTTQLRLWELAEPWDTVGVSWTVASGRASPTQWSTPGGTRGSMLGQSVWTPGDTTAAADSVRFTVDATAVARMAAAGFNGLVITSETAGARVTLSRVALQTSVRPAAHPDTTIALTIVGGPQTFIFSPEAQNVAGTLRVGGVTGDRAVLGIDLRQQVPGCANPATTPNCPSVSLRNVTINRASLVLSPVRTPGGLRPLVSPSMRIRRVVEPGLGRFAPLGQLLFADTVPVARFASPGGAPISIDLTGPLLLFNATQVEQLSIALLTEPEGGNFGYLYFTDRPRLRIVYTLPLRPSFP
ncbi:hypothetical protein BH23GEM8_BH23GEM8_15790 [soil metagenome]